MSRASAMGARFGLLLGLGVPLACVPDGRDDWAGGSDVTQPPPITDPGPPPFPFEPLGPTVSAAVPPPPITGGTLLMLRDGKHAAAADPERDAVFLVDLQAERLLAAVALEPGDEPGRLVEDAAGQVLVALRRGGAVVMIDPLTGTVTKRVPVCAAPRGIAVDGKTGSAHVACAGGELVSLAATTLEEQGRVQLDRDLRDVVVSGNHLFVSRFRAAEVLILSSADLSVIDRRKAPGSASANRPLRENGAGGRGGSASNPLGLRAAEPGVAWRMRALSGGGAMMLHQESSNGELGLEEGGYGGGPCRSPMGAAVAEFHEGAVGAAGAITSAQLAATLPIDFDVSPDGKSVAMLSLGGTFGTRAQISFTTREALYQDTGGCSAPPPPRPDEPIEYRPPSGEPTAIAIDGRGRLVVQTREPAGLEVLTHRGGSIKLSDDSRADTGHLIFHMPTALGMACASCHPEGGEDGRVWRFAKIGPRRTQSLRGGIVMTAPFHWDGDMRDLGHLMNEVFTTRMRGQKLDASQVTALGGWMDRIPALPLSPAADPAAVARGQLLFNDAKTACATCHKGALLTDNTSRAVGTGPLMQVPSLRGVAARAPYMHDGCAKTLMDRFDGTCGGGDKHGITSHLDRAQLQDLVAYLEGL